MLNLGGGTLTLDEATGSWGMIWGTLAGETVKQTQGSKLLFPGPNSVNTFDAMRVEGDLELNSPGEQARIRNGLTLIGTVRINTGAVTFSGDQSFNTGAIQFAGGRIGCD